MLDHEAEIGVAVVDLRYDLAVTDLQKGKQGERGADEFAAVVQRNSVRWAELNVPVLRNRIPPRVLTEISAEMRKSTVAVRLDAISQKIGTESPLGS